MQPHRISELKERVDEALEAGKLDTDAERELIDVLTPDLHEQTWPSVELVLHVAEHPVVAERLENERLPERLETALVEAFSAVLPLLGTRAFGPLRNFADRTRKAFDRERRKYKMVAERLDDERDDDRAVGLVRRYLRTEPAPLFVARLRQRRGRLVDEAEAQIDERADIERLVADSSVLAALEAPADADATQLREQIDELRRHADITPATLRRALFEGTDEEKLVAAAIAARETRTDLAPLVLEQVLAGSPYAPQMAVLAAKIAPLMARNVFSQFLAEAAWANPEDPEAKITAERTHAILAARCVLPSAGSPLDAMSEEQLPDAFDSEELRQVPARVEAMWTLWDEVDAG